MADIKHSVGISAPPERVRALVSSAAGFAQWWAADAVEEKDGTADMGFFNRNTTYRLKLTRKSEDEVIWRCETGKEWEGTTVSFRLGTVVLAKAGAITTLRFAHAGWKEETEYFLSCNTTWGALMYRLKAAAEGLPAKPLFAKDGFNL